MITLSNMIRQFVCIAMVLNLINIFRSTVELSGVYFENLGEILFIVCHNGIPIPGSTQFAKPNSVVIEEVARWFLVSSIRADSRLATSQWDTSLQSNAVSQWLGANLESALQYCYVTLVFDLQSWWRHHMEHFSCYWNFVTRSFDVFFHLPLNTRLSKQSRRRWFETPPRLLWRHCNDDDYCAQSMILAWRDIACLSSWQYIVFVGIMFWLCLPLLTHWSVHVYVSELCRRWIG